MASPYRQVSAKYQRANKHIEDFKSFVDVFRQSNPCSIRVERDEQAGEVSYFIASVPEIPVECSLLLGDALQNLRSALDYAAYFLVKRYSGETTTKTGFPIGESAQEYQAAFARKVPSAGQFAKEAIDRMRPYKGGNEHLWQLHRLNNIDKHRLLLTVCLTNPGRLMTPSEKDSFIQRHGAATDRIGKPIRYTFRQVIGAPVVPMKEGHKLLTIPITDANEQMGFVFDISLNEPDLPEGTPISLLLGFISSEVGICIRTLAPFL
jgi:hypothetical protein